MFRRLVGCLLSCSLLMLTQVSAFSEVETQEVLQNVHIDQKLNAQLPLDVQVVNESGELIAFGEYFDKRPVILAFVYYECPMLCTLVLNGLVRALKLMKFTAGEEFDVVAISVDPGETAEMARLKKEVYVKQYGRADDGWHFLTAEESVIKRIADTAGFYYVYDEETDEYAHASAVMVVTPEGKMARYFYGIDYPANDLRLALVEASKNKIGNLVDQVLLYCFHYDPETGKYGLVIMNVLRLIGLLTLGLIFGFIALNLKSKRKV